MQSYLALTNLIWIATISCPVSGHLFSFFPRFAVDRATQKKSMDRLPLSNSPSNYLTPLSDYESRSTDSARPVQPWTRILQNPVNAIEATVGSRVVLECKASGSPPPEVFWLTGSGTNDELVEYVKGNIQHLSDAEIEWKGLARIYSKLVIECVTPEDAGLIYCASVSEKQVKISSPTMLMVNGERGSSNCSAESEPTITLYSPTRVSTIGTTIVIPCRASGKPTPQISWVDNMDVPLSMSMNPRHRVLDNGDLLIEELLWEDMGGFTCKAVSGHHEQVVSTFLYPLRPENEANQSMN